MSRAALVLSLTLAACGKAPPYQGDWKDLLRGEKESKSGFVDRSGRWAIEPTFKYAARFSEGLASATGRGGYGYIDKTGAWAIKPEFTHAWDFSEGLAAVEVDLKKWGFIDKGGRYTVEPRFDEAHKFVKGIASVKIGKEWAFVDRTGKELFGRRFPDTPGFLYWKSDFSEEGVAVVEIEHGHFALLAADGSTVKEIEAEDVDHFHDGLALVKLWHDDRCHSNVYRYVNLQGEWAFPEKFCNAGAFSDGMAQVVAEREWGYIDRTGAFAIEPQFDVSGEFSEGLAAVKRDSRKFEWEYIDKTGKTVIAAVGKGRADAFKNGVAALDTWCPDGYWAAGARWGYIDKTGKLLAEFTRASSRKW